MRRQDYGINQAQLRYDARIQELEAELKAKDSKVSELTADNASLRKALQHSAFCMERCAEELTRYLPLSPIKANLEREARVARNALEGTARPSHGTAQEK